MSQLLLLLLLWLLLQQLEAPLNLLYQAVYLAPLLRELNPENIVPLLQQCLVALHASGRLCRCRCSA